MESLPSGTDSSSGGERQQAIGNRMQPCKLFLSVVRHSSTSNVSGENAPYAHTSEDRVQYQSATKRSDKHLIFAQRACAAPNLDPAITWLVGPPRWWPRKPSHPGLLGIRGRRAASAARAVAHPDVRRVRCETGALKTPNGSLDSLFNVH